ncbi:unnamed protein product [Victoria cruziana]
METMGCGEDTASSITAPDFYLSQRRLRPLIHRPQHLPPHVLPPSLPSSSSLPSSPRSAATNSAPPMNSFPTSCNELRRRGADPPSTVRSRWSPTADQLRWLEDVYRRGLRTPSAEQIQSITAQLRRFGKIEGKNVFYWFQNHKARERQKRRRRSETAAPLELVLDFDNPDKGVDPPHDCSSELDRVKNWAPGCRTNERQGDKWIRWDGELHREQQQREQQQEEHDSACGRAITGAAERVRSPSSLLQQPQLCPPDSVVLRTGPNRAAAGGAKPGAEDQGAAETGGRMGIRVTETLELFPLHSDSDVALECSRNARQKQRSFESDGTFTARFVEEDCVGHGRRFFQFLPLKN